MIKVSIIIPTYERRDSVKRLLKALNVQTFPDTDFEVIVSIDGSQDGTREMVQEFAASYELRYIWELNSGRASACNRGINDANGEVLIILDDDMEPSQGFVEAHCLSHSNSQKVGIVGAAPIHLDQSSSLVTQYRAKVFNARYDWMSEPGYQFRISDFYTGNFSIRRDLLLEIGEFNASFKDYGQEDMELAYRLMKAGIEILYSSQAQCTQYNVDDLSVIAKKSKLSGENVVLFANMHPETFHQFMLGSYYGSGWKWRSIRLFLIRSTMLIPPVNDAVIFLVDHIKVPDTKIQDKLFELVLDYSFWLGVWSAAAKDKNNNQIITKIRLFRKSKLRPNKYM